MFSLKDCEQRITEYCASSSSVSPLNMAMELMNEDTLRMHGPEHHFLVAAVLCSAWYNLRGEDSLPHLEKLRERCRGINPGVCGYYGVCGDTMAAGAFLSEAMEINYLSGKSWALINRFTARVQQAIGESCCTGPRCCKRSTFAVLNGAVEALQELFGLEFETNAMISCAFSALNTQCIKAACCFYERESVINE